jgi:hypothetical protein
LLKDQTTPNYAYAGTTAATYKGKNDISICMQPRVSLWIQTEMD